MKKWVFLSIVVSLLTSCQDSGQDNFGKSQEDSPHIVGGTVTSLQDPLTQSNLHLVYKWQSQPLKAENLSAHCTTTAVNSFTLVTAAHCVFPKQKARDYYIQMTQKNGTIEYLKVINTKAHEDYETGKDLNADIAILLVEKPLPSYIRKIRMPLPDQDLKLTNARIAVGGYGKEINTRAPRPNTARLKHILRRVISYKYTENTFLVDQHDDQGVCNGDSGAVAYIIRDIKSYGVGIVSRTAHSVLDIPQDESVCSGDIVFVNLQHYVPWIYKTSAELIDTLANNL
jgi:hypothetical protein